MADSPAQNDPLDEAFAAYLRSCDAGEVSSREEFLQQFPELADDLKQLMDAADLIGRMTLGGTAATGLQSTAESPAVVEVSPAADTVSGNLASGDDHGDPAKTLPMANRPAGDPGPTLPFDLGDYLLMEVIGRGGMGVVYLAKQNHLDRMVAVKMIRSGMLADEDEVRRFYTEAQAAARLHHSGIVSVYQFGRRAGHHFFSMEHIRGTDLQRKIDQASIDPKVAARYVRDVAQAIHHAHQNGVLHRDLKPANVLIDDNDQIHVTDFGLAKHLDSDSSVTRSGAAVGTPHYMAPEQAGGHSDRASRQSDVYAMGAVLFACVAGRPPIVADNVVQTLVRVVHDPAPPLRSVQSDAPADLETIVAKCLEKNPDKRYSSAAELAEELDAYLEGRPIAARPRSRVIKLWHWLEGVPLVGAISGRRMLKPSVGHRRFQAAMLLTLLITPIVFVSMLEYQKLHSHAMPSEVRLAGGLEGGIYTGFSEELRRRLEDVYPVSVEVVPSSGSRDNVSKLIAGEVDLAPMQSGAIRPKELCVVAPLFYEALHVLVRTDSGIQSVADLRNKKVAVGPLGSGSYIAAKWVFQSLQFSAADLQGVYHSEWTDFDQGGRPDAAMLFIGQKSELVSEMLRSGDWRLLPIPQHDRVAAEHLGLEPRRIYASSYPQVEIPEGGIDTVATRSFLVAREDAPWELVENVLNALYDGDPIQVDSIPRSQVDELTQVDFHPAASEFYFGRPQDSDEER